MSESSSSSASITRSITLRRREIAEYVEGRTQGYRVRFDVIEAVYVDANVFVYQHIPGATVGAVINEFSNVASPTDLEEYPVDEPVPGGRFFRLSYVDLVFRNLDLLTQSAEDLVSDISTLVTSLDQIDALIEHTVTLTGDSRSADLLVPVVK